MRILGIDYGARRIGIAVSDPQGKFALPYSVIVNTSKLLAEIETIAADNLIRKIIIGESRNYKGEANEILPDINELKNKLENKGFIVHLEPEFMTSIQAERLQGKSDMIDASAAAIILQSYLDRTHNDE